MTGARRWNRGEWPRQRKLAVFAVVFAGVAVLAASFNILGFYEVIPQFYSTGVLMFTTFVLGGLSLVLMIGVVIGNKLERSGSRGRPGQSNHRN